VAHHLVGEEMFLAHYGDTLTDAPLPELIAEVRDSGKVANFLCVPPRSYTFHTVDVGPDSQVRSIRDINRSDIWINGGYFVMRPAIFDYMRPGEELVHEPFQRLIDEGQLLAHRYDGFWAPMDTLKDRQTLEQLAEAGEPPWAVWERGSVSDGGRPVAQIAERPPLRRAAG
jgi:glucose-1-phosphate cytidylyltransferase